MIVRPGRLKGPRAKRRRNLLKWSQDFTQTGAGTWSNNNGATTRTGDSTVAPDGTTTADTVAGSGSYDGVFQNAATGATIGGKSFTFSVWIKAAGAGTYSIQLKGTPTTSDIAASQISVTTSWQRVSVSRTFNAGTTDTSCQVVIYKNADVSDTLNTVLLWGAQLTFGKSAEGYLATVGTAK